MVGVVLAVQEQPLQAAAVQQGSVALDRRADVAGAVEPVALGAGGSPFLLAERDEGLLGVAGSVVLEPGPVLGLGHDADDRVHDRVLDTAELGALAVLVGAGPAGLEVEGVRVPRDRIELAGELGHPPAVVDILRVELERGCLSDRKVEGVERDRPVRVRVLPVELVPVDPDLGRVAAACPLAFASTSGVLTIVKIASAASAKAGIAVQRTSSRVFPWI